MRMGLVGAGRIGTSHARVVRDHPLVDELLVADADPDRANQVAADLGVRAASSVDELFDGVDAVVVTAATTAHPELVIRGVRRRPPGLLREAGRARPRRQPRRSSTRSSGPAPQVQIGFQRRFDHGYGVARAALRGGELGELRRVHVVTGDQAPPPAEYIPTSGGMWRDCHVHDFDALRWVTGREVTEVYALGANRGADYFGASGDVDESRRAC